MQGNSQIAGETLEDLLENAKERVAQAQGDEALPLPLVPSDILETTAINQVQGETLVKTVSSSSTKARALLSGTYPKITVHPKFARHPLNRK